MSPAVQTEHFDPEVIQRLGRLDLIAMTIAGGVKHGLHRSRKRGFSTEFSEFKPYVAGDDPRLLDWRLFARTERFFVRRFEAETNLELLFLLDATGSMAWRWQQNISKLEYAANLLAALACIHLRQNDQVGLLVHDAVRLHHLPPRSQRTQLEEMFAVLAKLEPGQANSFAELVDSLAGMRRHRGQIIVCADLEEDDDSVAAAIELLAGREDEILLLHLLDRAEEELPFDNISHLRDSESGEMIPVRLDALRQEHGENVRRFRARWERLCETWGVQYQAVNTGMDYVEVIHQIAEDREARGG